MKKNNKPNPMNLVVSKITSVFIILLLTVFLFYTGDKGFADIQTSKFKAFSILCGGYVLISLLCIAEGIVIGVLKPESLKVGLKELSFLQKAVLVYLFSTWISAVVSEYFPVTVIGATRYEGAFTITIYCMVFFLVSIYGKAEKYMLWILTAVSVMFGLLCVVQLADINLFNLYPPGYKYSDAYKAYPGAYLGTIGNVDLVAAFLCLIIPILGVSFVKLKGKGRFILLFPLVVLLYVLIQMNVLAGIVGIVAGVLAVPIVLLRTKKSKLIYIASISVFGLAGLLTIYFVDFPFELLHQVHELLHGKISDTFGSGRIHIWLSVVADLPKHLWMGSGPDTMAYANLEAFKRFDTTLNTMLISGIDVAHNEYLNVLSQQGIFAFLSYISVVIYTVYKWLKTPSENTIAIVMGSALLCYFVQAFFGFSMCITAPFFWTVLGLFDKSLRKKNIPA